MNRKSTIIFFTIGIVIIIAGIIVFLVVCKNNTNYQINQAEYEQYIQLTALQEEAKALQSQPTPEAVVSETPASVEPTFEDEVEVQEPTIVIEDETPEVQESEESDESEDIEYEDAIPEDTPTSEIDYDEDILSTERDEEVDLSAYDIQIEEDTYVRICNTLGFDIGTIVTYNTYSDELAFPCDEMDATVYEVYDDYGSLILTCQNSNDKFYWQYTGDSEFYYTTSDEFYNTYLPKRGD